ncbi:MAG TPA: Crp/Fnr family transcriptional regulator [Thermoanaerobaculia bacterium]|nr:Crp/Fnr family transcriptional regulator [Thermoanaerobaculia bacterium]
MSSRYGFETIDECAGCSWQRKDFFCAFGQPSLAVWSSKAFSVVYPAGAVLFAEGQPSRGAMMICRGRVKLSVTSSAGRTIVTRVVDEGELIGLGNVLQGLPHDETAETMEPTQVKFIRSEDLEAFLESDPAASFRAALELSRECSENQSTLRTLGLSSSAKARLAALLVQWLEKRGKTVDGDVRLPLPMTHQEIGQMIGASRETVTRLMGELRGDGVIATRKSTVIVRHPEELQLLAQA